MPMSPAPATALQELQQQYNALQQQYATLQGQYQALQEQMRRQELATTRWLEQRNRELEAEAREQKKAETLQRVLYRIAERAAAGLSFYDFLQTIHGLLGELLYAKNCFVCLYDPKTQLKDFAYYVDERDGDTLQLKNVPFRRGLTEFVLRTAQPQIIDAQRLKQLEQQGEVTEGSGDMTFTTWLGVPMQIHGGVSGVLAVQAYEPGIQYQAADADVLSFVAHHVSSAIERYQALDEMRKSEARYRTVIENVGVGVVVVQDGRMVFANPSLVRIVGHPLEYLLSEPFTATVHPDDVAVMADRHYRRLRGETVEASYGFRIVTAAGEVRSLELSAVTIEWSQRSATLMFVVDATARLEAERAQRATVQRQLELNDMQSRFISMASHEFRTPLATIHGSAELLEHYADRLTPERKRMTLEKIHEAVQRMTHMLENVLVIGRAEAGQVEFRPALLPVTPFCNGVLDELRSAMTPQFERVRLQVELPPSDQRYWLDETLLRNIIGNLLSNALKYSPDGGNVIFSVQHETDHLVVRVSDHGIGIPEQDLPHLFESFHRASNVGPIAGTGLGLSIVKNAVDCHGGRIEVHSEVGKGSRFTVYLPLPAASRQGPAP